MTVSSRFETPNRPAEAASSGQLPLPVTVFMVGLVIPFIFMVGDLRLSVYRIVLVVMIVPLLFFWLSGRAGRIRVVDLALLALCGWTALSLAVIDGSAAAIKTGGIFFCETMGAYLLARCLIRTSDDFFRMARLLFILVVFLSPFAIIEATTQRNILLEFFNKVWPSYYIFSKDPRWGLQRVQAVFEHQILFGVFCGSALALTYMVLGHGKRLLRRVLTTSLVFFTGGLSLSSGPLTGMVVQILLIMWNSIFHAVRTRWEIFTGIAASMLIVVESISNRSAFAILLSYFAFNTHSAYYRIHIWRYTTASIAKHPLFGIGLGGDWERPTWMSFSVDMFWVVYGLRHGLPAMLLTLLAFFAVFVPLIFRRGLDEKQSDYRLGILFCLTGFFLTGWTVHYWNATYALFIFLLGSGVWLLDATPDSGGTPPSGARQRQWPAAPRYGWVRPTETVSRRQEARASGPSNGKPRKTARNHARSDRPPRPFDTYSSGIKTDDMINDYITSRRVSQRGRQSISTSPATFAARRPRHRHPI